MQPIRKVMSATHFKPADDNGKTKLTPCSPGDPAAKEMSWSDIESDELLEPPLRLADFLKSLESVRPTVTAEDIKKHDQWTLESGTSPFFPL
jgi:vacuolar protein-sorting-associated protein 4